MMLTPFNKTVGAENLWSRVRNEALAAKGYYYPLRLIPNVWGKNVAHYPVDLSPVPDAQTTAFGYAQTISELLDTKNAYSPKRKALIDTIPKSQGFFHIARSVGLGGDTKLIKVFCLAGEVCSLSMAEIERDVGMFSQSWYLHCVKPELDRITKNKLWIQESDHQDIQVFFGTGSDPLSRSSCFILPEKAAVVLSQKDGGFLHVSPQARKFGVEVQATCPTTKETHRPTIAPKVKWNWQTIEM